jgi:chemotaxis signal transduction protein
MDQMDQVERPGKSPFPAEFGGSAAALFDDKRTAPPQGARFVVFFSNDRLYAVPSAEVAEVVHPLPVTPLPGSPAWLQGIANLRGEIIAVFNLKRLWNVPNPSPPERAKLIVLRAERSQTAFAFHVDKLGEIVTIAESEIHPERSNDSPHIYAKVVRAPNTLHLLDAGRLVASLSFN